MIKLGSKGPNVQSWQTFLVGQGQLEVINGIFDQTTHDATVAFQIGASLDDDGIVGELTLAAAKDLGYPDAITPPRPPVARLKLLTLVEKQDMFGPILFVPDPKPGNPEGIRITNKWTKNLQEVETPQLAGVSGAPQNNKVLFHAKGAAQFAALWARWETDGLLPLVLSWSGGWAPRFIRGSRSVLSSHAFATAFDINAQWNPLGVTPPASGKTGSVRDLVAAAEEFGFFWGGNFPGRPDGMHFELMEIQ